MKRLAVPLLVLLLLLAAPIPAAADRLRRGMRSMIARFPASIASLMV